MRSGSLLALLASAPAVLGASQPLRLAPSSPWVVDYAENSCRLIRTFGEGASEVKLAFESEAPDEMDMLAFGKPLGSVAQVVSARFLPAGGESFPGRIAETSKGAVPAVVWGEVPLLPDSTIAALRKKQEARKASPQSRPAPRDLAQEAALKAQRAAFAAAATELAIQTGRNHTVLLETGSLGAPIQALDKCSRDSLKDWGVDAAIEDKIVRPVWAPSRAGWLTSRDYPLGLLRRGSEATVAVRLLIDATGRPTQCTSLSHFEEKEFNRISCDRIMERARFQPAELADGTKVPSYYVTRIVFRIGR